MKAKVVVNIENEPDAQASILTNNAIVGLTGNDNFVTPAILLATMKSDNDDFILAIAKAENNGKDEVLAKNLARTKVDDNFRTQGNYVNTTCKGDWTKAESSGFPLCQPRTPGQKQQLGASNTNVAGKIMIFCYLKVTGLIARVIQITQTPEVENSWKLVGVSKLQKHFVSNLTRKSVYYIRLANVTDPNVIDFCEPFSIVIL